MGQLPRDRHAYCSSTSTYSITTTNARQLNGLTIEVFIAFGSSFIVGCGVAVDELINDGFGGAKYYLM